MLNHNGVVYDRVLVDAGYAYAVLLYFIPSYELHSFLCYINTTLPINLGNCQVPHAMETCSQRLIHLIIIIIIIVIIVIIITVIIIIIIILIIIIIIIIII